MDAQLTYGDLTVDGSKISEAGLKALLQRGLSHLLGNEMSSKVNEKASWFKTFVEAQKRNPSDDEVAAAKVEFQKAAIASLYDGSIGTRAGGPRVDPVVAEMNAIAKREITDILKAQGIKKFPTGESTVTLGSDALSGEQLIGRRLSKYGDRIRKEAEKIVGERVRKAKAAAAAVAQVQAVGNAEDLGL